MTTEEAGVVESPLLAMPDHFRHMHTALALAREAHNQGEVPVGCVIVDDSKKLVGKGCNLKEQYQDASLHAEMVALKAAAKNLATWRLEGCSLYVTLEPCPMCLAAMGQFRIKRLFFGAYDLKGGGISLNFNLHQHAKLNHRFATMGGLCQEECAQLMSNFFYQKRNTAKADR